MALDFEKYRMKDHTINLVEAFEDEHAGEFIPGKGIAINYLKLIANYFPIKSRQVAAVCLANADLIMLNKTK